MRMRLRNRYIQQLKEHNGHCFERYSEWLEITDDVKLSGYSLLEFAPVKSDSDESSLSTVDDSRSYAMNSVAFEDVLPPVRSRDEIPPALTRDKIPHVPSRDELPSGDELPASISGGE